MKNSIFPIIFLFVIILSFSACATFGYINACGTIQYDGEYILNQSITSSTNCLTVTASNVTINLSGYRITTTGQTYSAISLNNASASGTYYIFDGELYPAYSLTTLFCVYSNGGTLSLKNIKCLNGGSGFVFLNTNVTIIDSSYAGTYLPIQVLSTTGEYYQLNINNSNISSSVTYTYIKDIGTFPNLNRSIMKIFNSRFTGGSTSFLYNGLGASLNNDSQIVNCYFGSASTTYLNGFRGNLNNANRGNYYASGGFGYSEVCTPYSDGICSIPNNFSAATDYYPIQNISLLNLPVSTSFTWNPANYVQSPGTMPVYLWSRNACPDANDPDYLFCDNFQYSTPLNQKGWTDANNQTPSYSTGSQKFLLQDVPLGVYANFYASFWPESVYVSNILNTSHYHVNTEYNTNAAVVEFSFDFVVLNGSSLLMGISSIYPEDLVAYGIDPETFYWLPAYWDYFGLFYNGVNKGIYVYNYSAADYQLVKLVGAYNKNVNIKIYLYPRDANFVSSSSLNQCRFYFKITESGNTTTSEVYEAGFTDLTIAGQEIPTVCDDVSTMYFYSQNDLNIPIDNVYVKKYADSQSLNLRLWDCSEMNTPVQQNQGYVNEYPIIADAEVNGVIYTSDVQGMIDIPSIQEGTYKIKVSYESKDNYIVINTSSNSSFRQNICWFNTVNQSANVTENRIDSFGVSWSKKTKDLFGLISTLAVVVGVGMLLSNVAIALVCGVLSVAVFTALGFFEFWVVILLVSAIVGALLIAIRPGGQ